MRNSGNLRVTDGEDLDARQHALLVFCAAHDRHSLGSTEGSAAGREWDDVLRPMPYSEKTGWRLLCNRFTIRSTWDYLASGPTCEDWKCDIISLMSPPPALSLLSAQLHMYVAFHAAYEPVAGLLGPARTVDPELEGTFHSLAESWRRNTRILSSVTAKAMDEAYQRIIGMGPAVLPLVLTELRKQPDHWFWALRAITRDDPVPPEDAGDIERMRAAWLRYGEEHGYL